MHWSNTLETVGFCLVLGGAMFHVGALLRWGVASGRWIWRLPIWAEVLSDGSFYGGFLLFTIGQIGSSLGDNPMPAGVTTWLSFGGLCIFLLGRLMGRAERGRASDAAIREDA